MDKSVNYGNEYKKYVKETDREAKITIRICKRMRRNNFINDLLLIAIYLLVCIFIMIIPFNCLIPIAENKTKPVAIEFKLLYSPGNNIFSIKTEERSGKNIWFKYNQAFTEIYSYINSEKKPIILLGWVDEFRNKLILIKNPKVMNMVHS